MTAVPSFPANFYSTQQPGRNASNFQKIKHRCTLYSTQERGRARRCLASSPIPASLIPGSLPPQLSETPCQLVPSLSH